MNPLDPESQFYPFISTAICGNEDPTVVRHIIFLSFYENSSDPPPLSDYWNLSRYP